MIGCGINIKIRFLMDTILIILRLPSRLTPASLKVCLICIMKNGKRLLFLYNDLSAAITSFEKSLEIDLAKYSDFEAEVIKNGQIRKI